MDCTYCGAADNGTCAYPSEGKPGCLLPEHRKRTLAALQDIQRGAAADFLRSLAQKDYMVNGKYSETGDRLVAIADALAPSKSDWESAWVLLTLEHDGHGYTIWRIAGRQFVPLDEAQAAVSAAHSLKA